MSPRTLTLQNQIRSTTSGIEYDDTLSLSLAESLVNESFILDDAQVSGTLIMDLNFLRTAIRDIKGETSLYNWHDPTSSTPGLITLSGARSAITNLQTFVGSNSDSNTTPNYSSSCFISPNDPLETAISTLDYNLCVTTGTIGQGQEIQKRVLILNHGHIPQNTTIDINNPGSDWTVYGDDIQLTSSGVFMEAVKIYTNGILQLTGADSSADNDVYWVAANYDIAFEYKVTKNDVIQIYKFPSTP